MWKFWKRAGKEAKEEYRSWELEVSGKLGELEARLKEVEAMASRVQTKVYRDINKGVVFEPDDKKVDVPLTNLSAGDMVDERMMAGLG